MAWSKIAKFSGVYRHVHDRLQYSDIHIIHDCIAIMHLIDTHMFMYVYTYLDVKDEGIKPGW